MDALAGNQHRLKMPVELDTIRKAMGKRAKRTVESGRSILQR